MRPDPAGVDSRPSRRHRFPCLECPMRPGVVQRARLLPALLRPAHDGAGAPPGSARVPGARSREAVGALASVRAAGSGGVRPRAGAGLHAHRDAGHRVALPAAGASSGFALAARRLGDEVAVHEHERERLEHLCRYVLRPPLALDRLKLLGPDKRVRGAEAPVERRDQPRDHEPAGLSRPTRLVGAEAARQHDPLRRRARPACEGPPSSPSGCAAAPSRCVLGRLDVALLRPRRALVPTLQRPAPIRGRALRPSRDSAPADPPSHLGRSAATPSPARSA